jgi:hypothetical protein
MKEGSHLRAPSENPDDRHSVAPVPEIDGAGRALSRRGKRAQVGVVETNRVIETVERSARRRRIGHRSSNENSGANVGSRPGNGQSHRSVDPRGNLRRPHSVSVAVPIESPLVAPAVPPELQGNRDASRQRVGAGSNERRRKLRCRRAHRERLTKLKRAARGRCEECGGDRKRHDQLHRGESGGKPGTASAIPGGHDRHRPLPAGTAAGADFGAALEAGEGAPRFREEPRRTLAARVVGPLTAR